MSPLTEIKRQIHVNKSCDRAEKAARLTERRAKERAAEEMAKAIEASRSVWERAADETVCIVCNKDLSDPRYSIDRMAHLKFCVKSKGFNEEQ